MSDRIALVCTGCGEILPKGVKMTQAKAEHASCVGIITSELVTA